MPRRLLREPHLLAHELRTPLSVLAGWLSLIRDGDVTETDKHRWETAMNACQRAVDRLNLVIAEACGEVTALKLRRGRIDAAQLQELLDATRAAIDQSQELMERIQHHRRLAPAAATRAAARPPV